MAASVNRFRAALPSQYLRPLLLLIGTCFGSIFLLLLFSTRAQDGIEQHREAQALEGAFATASDMVRHDLQDYAKWDDAVRHITLRFSSSWVDDNVVAYLGRTQGYSEIFVLDGENRTIYSFHDRAAKSTVIFERLGPGIASAIAQVRQLPKSAPPIISGYVRWKGEIFLYSAAAVVPLTGKVSAPDGPEHLLIIARRLNPALVTSMTRNLKLQKVRLRLSAEPTAETHVQLTDRNGDLLARIEWTPHRPGTELRRRLAPAIAVLTLLAFIAAASILRRGGQAVKALRKSEQHALHLSHHDQLTGLPNRRALVSAIGDQLGQTEGLSLLYMDLDGFKDANDVYGHAMGDSLLKEAAARIVSAAPNSLVARTGGDEFAVLLSPGNDAQSMSTAILEHFGDPVAIGGYLVRLGVSIGCVETGAAASVSQDELMRRADVAMYAAKADGKRCARFYSPALDQDHHVRVQLERELETAANRGEIYVDYQPIVEARSGEIIAVEALARWKSPLHGQVPPDLFIPVAERSGLINVIGGSVLKAACMAMRDTQLQLAVNLSPAQFWDRGLLDSIKQVLLETGFPPQRLELEITESLLLRRPQMAAEVIEGLRTLGIRIALDDFGTGFASVGYLRQLKLDRIKIDKIFIDPVERDGKAREMLIAIAGLAAAFGLEVCAEGVETDAQARLATAAGCTRLQGWRFGRPQSRRGIIAALAPSQIIRKLDDLEWQRVSS